MDDENSKKQPEGMHQEIDNSVCTAGDHDRSVKLAVSAKVRVKSPPIVNVSCHRAFGMIFAVAMSRKN